MLTKKEIEMIIAVLNEEIIFCNDPEVEEQYQPIIDKLKLMKKEVK